MRIALESRPAPHEQAFLNLLAGSCKALGHEAVRWDTAPWVAVSDHLAELRPRLTIQWGGERKSDLPTLHAELGWLPRWHYQLSHTGINAKHHMAAPTLKPLTADEERAVEMHLRECREGRGCPFPYADPRVPPATNVPADGFVLAPLQMPQDTNMENAPEHLRTEQGFIDAVSEMDPPWPVIFKQHPHSGAGYQVELRPPPGKRREQVEITTVMDPKPQYIDGVSRDRIAPHAEASIHAYLKSPACRAVVTVNSNTAHDALLWGVPVLALGAGMWGPGHDFSDAVIHWHEITGNPNPAYVHHLTRAQWRLEDAADLGRVARAVGRAVG